MDQVSEFCEAVWRENTLEIARLIPQIDPNAEDRWHRRPLSMAAQYGDARLVRELLDRGAEVDAGRSQLTPIAHAAARGAHEIVELLRSAGAVISVVTSVYLGDRRAVAEADLVVDEEGTPLLLHAAQSLDAQIVGDLLDGGANTAATDRFGETALHRVADLRRTDGPKAGRVARLLIERGALVDACNRDGVTALHQAVRARNLAVVEVLLDRGANLNAADKRGSTPLHRASSSTGAGNTVGIDPAPFVDLLLARGADPKQKDKRGRVAWCARDAGR
ncbi:MAG: ankyrin repeat domain-containing protein [Planctomycetes bacterium]|nr:ankyrin repeat domain-containing protein [Planctomycetota bacterium]